MKINEINYFIRSSTGWDALYVINIGISMTVLKTLKNLSCLHRFTCKKYAKYYGIVQNVKYDYIQVSYVLYIYFYHVGDKKIIKQKIP